MEFHRVQELFESILEQVGQVVVGQQALVEGVVIALFAEGSVLIEGPPGLGKTLLVNVLSKTVSCQFRRVQFTPDLMPSDLTGHSIYDMRKQEFTFNRGPVFTNLLLTDEINRSPPKTQSALLEVMQEQQVSVDGTTHRLQRPFLVIATQNPIEHEGTYPLPEAQVDRFMFKLLVDYPAAADEAQILGHYAAGRDTRRLDDFHLQTVLQADQVLEIQQAVKSVIVEPKLLTYIVSILNACRTWGSVTIGPSPRAGVNMLIAARTLAACRGRDFVTPDDIKELAPWILRHRLRLRPEAELEGTTIDETIEAILESVEAPKS
ncbi:MAG TPA: magnesium chelatase [Planctomycetaceae bacterium]|jgi:MoxR-like ATPase|nr:magnesium chelatase [Planctomycetaceae bacterium]